MATNETYGNNSNIIWKDQHQPFCICNKLSDSVKKMPQEVPKNFSKNMTGLLQNGTIIQAISSI